MAPETYNVAKQYQNSTNLSARIQLHSRFSTNPYGWLRWVFDQFDLPPQSRILELGWRNCNPGFPMSSCVAMLMVWW